MYFLASFFNIKYKNSFLINHGIVNMVNISSINMVMS